MQDNMNNFIWEHKYRAKKIKDVILPTDYRNFFQKILDSNGAVNLILSSSTPGTGKSTVAQALANDLHADFLKLNASDSNGIETIRTTVTNFAQTMSFTGAPKIVLLDEADGLTPDAQKALRPILDDLSDNCRFILTCNYISKIIPALRGDDGGRTITLEFDMNKPEYRAEMIPQIQKRIKGILKFEQVEFDSDVVDKFIDLKYPSIRTMIAKLQGYVMMRGRVDDGLISYVNIGEELTKLIMSKELTKSMAYINEHALSYTDVFSYIKTDIIPKLAKKGDAYIALSEYDFRAGMSSDPEIQIIACLVSMFTCI